MTEKLVNTTLLGFYSLIRDFKYMKQTTTRLSGWSSFYMSGNLSSDPQNLHKSLEGMVPDLQSQWSGGGDRIPGTDWLGILIKSASTRFNKTPCCDEREEWKAFEEHTPLTSVPHMHIYKPIHMWTCICTYMHIQKTPNKIKLINKQYEIFR